MSTTTKKSFAERRNEAEAAVEAMHATLAEHITTGAEWVETLRFARRFHRYSPNNVLLMWAQWETRRRAVEIGRALEAMFFGAPLTAPLPPLTFTAGFSAWKDMGGQVRKGEKALTVLAPFTITDHEHLDEQGRPTKKCIGFVLKNRTFDISQVEGVEAPPAPVTLLTGEGAPALWESLVALAAHEGYTVTIAPVPGEANGFCDYIGKRIVVEQANDPAQQVKTLAHEIGHMLLHADARGVATDVREVEAESVAYSVLAAAGIDSAAYSFGYVGTWANGNGALIAATLERVAHTTARILTFVEEGTLPDAKPCRFYDSIVAGEADAAARAA